MDWLIQSKDGRFSDIPTTLPRTISSRRLKPSSVALRSSSSAPPCLMAQCSMRPPRGHCWVRRLPSERVVSDRLQSGSRSLRYPDVPLSDLRGVWRGDGTQKCPDGRKSVGHLITARHGHLRPPQGTAKRLFGDSIDRLPQSPHLQCQGRKLCCPGWRLTCWLDMDAPQQ
jgi:hypothetical protein